MNRDELIEKVAEAFCDGKDVDHAARLAVHVAVEAIADDLDECSQKPGLSAGPQAGLRAAAERVRALLGDESNPYRLCSTCDDGGCPDCTDVENYR